MTDNVLSLGRQVIHGTDSNSLLRMFDLASAIFNKSSSQQQRAKAEKTMQRISKELEHRKVWCKTDAAPSETSTPND